MGTTISAVLVDAAVAAVANIGDSRVYLFRNGELEQLSCDDTIAGGLNLTAEAAVQPAIPMIRSIITRAAGSHETAEAHIRECRLQNNDAILLCSDGLHACLSDERIRDLLTAAGTALDRAASSLIEAARGVGAPDNVSAALVRYTVAPPT
jgi:protein phosphatase